MGSLIILFDGLYSLVSLILSLIALAASISFNQPRSSRYWLSRKKYEPVVLLIKGAVLLALLLQTMYSSTVSLLSGGQELNTLSSCLFGVVNVIGCGVTWYYISTHAKKSKSKLTQAEARQWVMDMMLSMLVAVAFLIGYMLTVAGQALLANYIDPVLTLLASLWFIKMPTSILKEAIRGFSTVDSAVV